MPRGRLYSSEALEVQDSLQGLLHQRPRLWSVRRVAERIVDLSFQLLPSRHVDSHACNQPLWPFGAHGWVAPHRDALSLGADAIKVFLAYPELGIMASVADLRRAMVAAAQVGLPVQVHCEDGDLIEALVSDASMKGERGARLCLHPTLSS